MEIVWLLQCLEGFTVLQVEGMGMISNVGECFLKWKPELNIYFIYAVFNFAPI